MRRINTTKHLVLAILDFVIIGIVIYGLTDWVYEGYPSWVPYAIMIFFFIMSTIRFYKFSSALKKNESVDSHNLESLFSDDGTDGENEKISPKGFHKRSRRNPYDAE